MHTFAIRCWLASAMIVSVPAAASAAISRDTISAPGGFAQAGAYSATCGCGMNLGNDMALHFGMPQDFHEQEFAGVSSAQASAAYGSLYINNNANVTAGLGIFRPFAANSARPADFFPMSAAHGGWKESFSVSNAALSGQAGYMVFQIRARGTLSAASHGGSSSLTFQSYKDGSSLTINPYYDRGNSDLVGNSFQHGYWGAATFGGGEVVDRTIDGIVTMAVPITFGQPFTLGVYTLALAGMRSSGAVYEISTARCDFSGDGVTWNGIVNILDAAGQPVAGSTITSGSGIDWIGPYPGTVGVGQFDTPTGMSLHATSTTPFAGEVRFSLFLPHAAAARVGVYDVLGRRIRALADGWHPVGQSELVWDGRTAEGVTAGTGVYFVRAEWEGQVAVQRLVRVR